MFSQDVGMQNDSISQYSVVCSDMAVTSDLANSNADAGADDVLNCGENCSNKTAP